MHKEVAIPDAQIISDLKMIDEIHRSLRLQTNKAVDLVYTKFLKGTIKLWGLAENRIIHGTKSSIPRNDD